MFSYISFNYKSVTMYTPIVLTKMMYNEILKDRMEAAISEN
jgi:hypothetical protein